MMPTDAIPLLALVAMLDGCSPQRPVPQPAPDAPGRCASPPAGGPLAIEHVWPDDTGGGGTMHAPDRTRLTLGGATVVLATDVERGTLAPAIAHQLALGGGRHLLLGRSSWGSGNATVHAVLLVSGPGVLRVADHLELTQRRGASLLLVDRSGQVRLGLLGPPSHPGDAIEWRLQLGDATLEADDAATLGLTPLGATRDRIECYVPETAERAAPSAATPVAWVAIDGERFRLAAAPSPPSLGACQRPPMERFCVQLVLFTRDPDGGTSVHVIGDGFTTGARPGPRVQVGSVTPSFQMLGGSTLSARLPEAPAEGAHVLVNGWDTGHVFRASSVVDATTTVR